MTARLSIVYRAVSVTILGGLTQMGCTALAPTPPYGAMGEPQAQDEEAANGAPEASPYARGADAPSPVELETGGLTLGQCVEVALARNPDVLAAGGEADAARAEARIKAGARLPAAQLTGSYFHFQDTQRLGVPSPPGQAQYFANDIAAADVVLRLPLYAGGRIVNEFRAAELLALAEKRRLSRTRNETAFNVTSVYYSILAQEKLVESAAFSRETLAQHLARVEELIAAEKAARVDALRTGVRLAEVEHQLLGEQNTRDIQYRLLANLMGLEKNEARDLTLAGELDSGPEFEELHVEAIVAKAYAQRSDYAALRAEREAQARRVDVARGAREPEVTLEASYGGRWGFGGSGEPQSGGSRSIGLDASGNPTWTQTWPVRGGGGWTGTFGPQGLTSQRYALPSSEPADSFEDLGRIGLTVNLPLFEGGRIQAGIRKERARLRTAEQRLRRLELDIRLEAETAALNAASARKRIRVTRASRAEAEESLRIERLKYDLGKGAIVDVLDAQDALLNAQTNYYGALSDYRIAQAQVGLVTGDIAP